MILQLKVGAPTALHGIVPFLCIRHKALCLLSAAQEKTRVTGLDAGKLAFADLTGDKVALISGPE